MKRSNLFLLFTTLLSSTCYTQNEPNISVSSKENVNVLSVDKDSNAAISIKNIKAPHYIGEEFGGGVIFQIYQDRQGVDHGLIVSKQDIGYSYEYEQIWNGMTPTSETRVVDSSKVYNWCPVINDYVKLVKASNLRDGLKNSNLIIENTESSAAAICLNLTENGFDDWYLPAIEELNFLFRSKKEVFSTTEQNATIMEGLYWSSTEINDRNAWSLNFSSGTKIETKKQEKRNIRAIRAF